MTPPPSPPSVRGGRSPGSLGDRVLPALGDRRAGPGADHQQRAAGLGLAARRRHRLLVLGVDQGRGRLGVAEDVGDLRALEPVADLDRGRAHPGQRLLRDQVVGAVGQHQRDPIAAVDVARGERVGQPVDLGVELAPGQAPGRAALERLDDRLLVGRVVGVEHDREVRAELGATRRPHEAGHRAGAEGPGHPGPAEHLGGERRVLHALAEAIDEHGLRIADRAGRQCPRRPSMVRRTSLAWVWLVGLRSR